MQICIFSSSWSRKHFFRMFQLLCTVDNCIFEFWNLSSLSDWFDLWDRTCIILNSVDFEFLFKSLKWSKPKLTIPWGIDNWRIKAIRARTRQRILRVFIGIRWLRKLLSVSHAVVYPILSPRLHKSLLSATGVKCSCTRCYWVDGYFLTLLAQGHGRSSTSSW